MHDASNRIFPEYEIQVDYLAFLLSAMNRRDAIDLPFFLIIILFIYLISF